MRFAGKLEAVGSDCEDGVVWKCLESLDMDLYLSPKSLRRKPVDAWWLLVEMVGLERDEVVSLW
jgi:hypothetical protein